MSRSLETLFLPRDGRIVQYSSLLMPVSVSKNDSAAEKLRAYKNPEQCLTEFSNWYEPKASDPEARAKCYFTVQIAPFAIEEDEDWERHEGWNGHRVWEETKKGGIACTENCDRAGAAGRQRRGPIWGPIEAIPDGSQRFSTVEAPLHSGA